MTDEDRGWYRSEFERCAPYIQAALDRSLGTHNLEDVWELLAAGRAQLWPLPKSAIVTLLDYYPRKIVLQYWLCGGDLKECVASTPNIEDWAKEAGATLAVINGREGWLRTLPGYDKNSISMTKAI